MAVAEYTKQAIKRYNEKFDRITINFPKGTKERIQALNVESVNKWIALQITAELERLESKTE